MSKYRVTATCDRCKKTVEGMRFPEGTAGFYEGRHWKKYMNEGEAILCDACMWAEPRYQVDYVGGLAQEDFFDAVRADPTMTQAQKDRWLALELPTVEKHIQELERALLDIEPRRQRLVDSLRKARARRTQLLNALRRDREQSNG